MGFALSIPSLVSLLIKKSWVRLWDFSLMVNYSMCFCVSPSSVMCCLLRRLLYSADTGQGGRTIVPVFLYVLHKTFRRCRELVKEDKKVEEEWNRIEPK